MSYQHTQQTIEFCTDARRDLLPPNRSYQPWTIANSRRDLEYSESMLPTDAAARDEEEEEEGVA